MDKTIGEVLGDEYATVVALGDSITALTHWTHGGLNWVGLLQCNLGTCFRKGGTVINSGIGGDSLRAGMARLDRDVMRFSPTLVIISFGMNDAGGGRDTTAFSETLRAMIRRLRGAGARILLRTPNPIIDMSSGLELTEIRGEGAERPVPYYVGDYAAAIVQVAREEETWVADHYSLWKKSIACKYHGEMRLLMGDCMHPNANGHRRFYHEMAPVFGAELTFQHEWQHILEHQ